MTPPLDFLFTWASASHVGRYGCWATLQDADPTGQGTQHPKKATASSPIHTPKKQSFFIDLMY
tara:strand:+ start:510 stop:698 length:189 start_codon:yes stop_codon:yes gene_type:complete